MPELLDFVKDLVHVEPASKVCVTHCDFRYSFVAYCHLGTADSEVFVACLSLFVHTRSN